MTDDGVPYGETIRALDLSRSYGYHHALLGGGPPLSPREPVPDEALVIRGGP